MKVEAPEYANALANDPTAVGVYVSISRGGQELEAYFITDDVGEEFGRVSGTMLNALSILEDAEVPEVPAVPGVGNNPGTPAIPAIPATKAIPLPVMAELKRKWRTLIHA